MNHRERAIVALDGGKPDFVPHFEVEFQETAELFAGRALFGLPGESDRTGLTPKEINLHNARLRVDIARDLDHSIIGAAFAPGA